MTNHTDTSLGAGAPSTKQGALAKRPIFTVSATYGSIMLKIDKNRVLAPKRVFQ